MKIFLPVLVAIACAVSSHAGMIVPRAGLDLPGTFESENGSSVSNDTEMGFSAGVEYLYPMSERFNAGAGAFYQFPRKIDDDTDRDFNFLPVYLTGTFLPFPQSEMMINPYIKANIGYNALYDGNSDFKADNTLKPGLYWAAGIGSRIMKSVSVDIMYQRFAGEYEFEAFPVTLDTTYSLISLNFGYEFDLLSSEYTK